MIGFYAAGAMGQGGDPYTIAKLPLTSDIIDLTGRSWSMLTGSEQYDSGAFDFDTTNVIGAASSADFAFGTGDFYIGGYFVRTRTQAEERLVGMRWATPTPGVDHTYGNVLAFRAGKLAWSNGTAWRESSSDVPLNARTLCEVSRAAGTLTIKIGGATELTVSESVNLTGNRPCLIGARDTGDSSANKFLGRLDGLIIRKGSSIRAG